MDRRAATKRQRIVRKTSRRRRKAEEFRNGSKELKNSVQGPSVAQIYGNDCSVREKYGPWGVRKAWGGWGAILWAFEETWGRPGGLRVQKDKFKGDILPTFLATFPLTFLFAFSLTGIIPFEHPFDLFFCRFFSH